MVICLIHMTVHFLSDDSFLFLFICIGHGPYDFFFY